MTFIFKAEEPERRGTKRSVSQTKLFMHCRAEDERRELSSAKFISLMSDGCTDSSVMEKEMVEECRAEQVVSAAF